MDAQRGFKGLDAWKIAMDLVEQVYRHTNSWPTDERFGLTNQVRRAVVSVPSNIAEGQGRNSTGDFARLVSIAFGSLAEVETQILLGLRLQYSTEEDVQKLLDHIHETAKVVQGLSRYLRHSSRLTTND